MFFFISFFVFPSQVWQKVSSMGELVYVAVSTGRPFEEHLCGIKRVTCLL